jgi:hypothetical protein
MTTNGTAEATLVDDWDVVQTNGRLLVGAAVPDFTPLGGGFVLRPVYDLLVQIMPQPNGALNWGYMATPVMMFCDVAELEVPPGALVIPLAGLSVHIRKQIEAAVKGAREIIRTQAPLAVAPCSLVVPAAAGSEGAVASALRLARMGRKP